MPVLAVRTVKCDIAITGGQCVVAALDIVGRACRLMILMMSHPTGRPQCTTTSCLSCHRVCQQLPMQVAAA